MPCMCTSAVPYGQKLQTHERILPVTGDGDDYSASDKGWR